MSWGWRKDVVVRCTQFVTILDKIVNWGAGFMSGETVHPRVVCACEYYNRGVRTGREENVGLVELSL